jgi:hypothetical protein
MVAVSKSRTINNFIDHAFKAARAAEIPSWDEDNFRYAMQIFEDIFTTSPCGFRTTNHSPKKRDLDVRYFDAHQLSDPYTRALQAELLAREGHPIEALTREIQTRIPLCGYGADIGVRYGFKKIWPVPVRGIPLEDLYNLSAMPPSFAAHADYFRKYGMATSGLLALDYHNKTVNTYVSGKGYTPNRIREMFEDLEFPVPPRDLLELISSSLCIYQTFNWERPEIERISFVLVAPGDHLIHHADPVIQRFAAEVPSLTPTRMFTYNPTYGRLGDYWKVEIDYTATMGETIMYIIAHDV